MDHSGPGPGGSPWVCFVAFEDKDDGFESHQKQICLSLSGSKDLKKVTITFNV